MHRGLLSLALVAFVGGRSPVPVGAVEAFPPELVDFGPVSAAPLFAGGGPDVWDRAHERLGFEGRGEGIATQAVALLVRAEPEPQP